MISSIVSRLVILVFGTLYPAYASYKAVRTKNVKEYVKWMMYWIVFALFTCAETFTDVFFSFWFPFYYEIKVILVLWLLSPATKGSSILYRKFVHPMLTKREQEIDDYISRAKEQGYHTVLSLGTKGVNYATSVIMQTAIKGGGGLVNQLRRSYSLGDISSDMDIIDINRINNAHPDDQVDCVDGSMDPRILRQRGYTTRTASGGKVDIYFPEVDVDVRQRGNRSREPSIPLSHIRSSEDVSSGYSSADPLYCSQAKTEENREALVRTSSVGSTRVTRTKTTRANVAAKRPPTEEGSVPSDESEESDSLNQEEHFYDVSTTSTLEPVFIPIPENLSQPIATLASASPAQETPSEPVKHIDKPVFSPPESKSMDDVILESKTKASQPETVNSITVIPSDLDHKDDDAIIAVRMPVVILPSVSTDTNHAKVNISDSSTIEKSVEEAFKELGIIKKNALDSSLHNSNNEECLIKSCNVGPAENALEMEKEVALSDQSEFFDAADGIPSSETVIALQTLADTSAVVVFEETQLVPTQSVDINMETNVKDSGKDDRAGKYKKRLAPCPPKKSDLDTDLNEANDASSLNSETSSRDSPSPRRELSPLKQEEPSLVHAESFKINKDFTIPASLMSGSKPEKYSKDGSKSPKPSEKKAKSKQDSPISRLLSSIPFWHNDGSRRLVATSLTSLNHLEDLRAMSSGSAANLVTDSMPAPPLPPRKKSQEASAESSERGKQFRMRDLSHSPPRRQQFE